MNALSLYIPPPQLHLPPPHTIHISEEPGLLFRPFGASLGFSQMLWDASESWLCILTWPRLFIVFQITHKHYLTQKAPNLFHAVLETFPDLKIETFLTALMYSAHTRARKRELGEGLSGLENSHTSAL